MFFFVLDPEAIARLQADAVSCTSTGHSRSIDAVREASMPRCRRRLATCCSAFLHVANRMPELARGRHDVARRRRRDGRQADQLGAA